MFKKITIALVFACSISLAQSRAYIAKTENSIKIGNKFLERVISIFPDKTCTVEIINKCSGTDY